LIAADFTLIGAIVRHAATVDMRASRAYDTLLPRVAILRAAAAADYFTLTMLVYA